MPSEAQVGAGWFKELSASFQSQWFKEVRRQVGLAYENGKVVPKPADIFRAYRETPYEDVKVVIIGQDPYPKGDHADGLAFSSKQPNTPMSLQIIFEDLERKYGIKPTTNELTRWANQGVLLLNTALTVVKDIPMSHAGIGWDKLVIATLEALKRKTGLVYMAWGTPARQLITANVDLQNNLVLTSVHPVAQSYSRGTLKFNGKFEEANEYLVQQGKEKIQWV